MYYVLAFYLLSTYVVVSLLSHACQRRRYTLKADWFGWPIVGAAVLTLLFGGAEQTRAATITFEDLGVPVGTRLDILPPGTGVITGGFNYTPGPINSPFNDLHISNQEPNDSFNGTTVGITHDDVVLTKVGDGTFSLQSFDFAGFPQNAEVPFMVTGVRADLSTITQTFLPDDLVDGMGGVVDFQTFSLVGNWTNLSSVTWTHTGNGTDRGLFALDTIVVNQTTAVPEPSTITLLGLGILCLLGQGWRARKRLKTLGDMA